MIVVLGRPALVPAGPAAPARPGGRAGAVALACATRGRSVELAGAIGDDRDGDALAVALGRAGIGHAALLRDPAARTPRTDAGPGTAPAPRLDGGDVDLALRYLTGCRVLIVADPLPPDVATVAAEAAAWHAVPLVVLADPRQPLSAAWGPDAIVLGIPEAEDDEEDGAPDAAGPTDPATDGAFPALVADLALALADGAAPADALAGAIAAARGERTDGR
ncbi:MAG: hypothetical protein ACKOTZ_02365 [Chloroflexota bacterium]